MKWLVFTNARGERVVCEMFAVGRDVAGSPRCLRIEAVGDRSKLLAIRDGAKVVRGREEVLSWLGR